MKENSMSYRTAKQETERLICEIEEMTITHRAYTAECLRRVLKENEELKEDLKYVLNQTLGAFEKNWCIDWNFTEIREKYNLESE